MLLQTLSPNHSMLISIPADFRLFSVLVSFLFFFEKTVKSFHTAFHSAHLRAAFCEMCAFLNS